MFAHMGGGQCRYRVRNSVKLRAAVSGYMTRTYGVPTAQKTWTLSFWLKRISITADRQILSTGVWNGPMLGFHSTDDQLWLWNNSGTYAASSSTTFTDTASHHHFVLKADGANLYIYVDNTQELYWADVPNFNVSGGTVRIGDVDGTGNVDAYMSDIIFVDGQGLTPSSFGETRGGVWVPKRYTGTYGNNGFWLRLNDGSSLANLGLDRSGNGNNWTVSNVSLPSDWTTDTPT